MSRRLGPIKGPWKIAADRIVVSVNDVIDQGWQDMLRRLTRLLFVLVVLVAAAVSTSVTTAKADPTLPSIDFCAIAPPNLSHTLTNPQDFMASSVDGSYANSACGRYIFDLFVPPGTGSFGLYGTAEWGPAEYTSQTCNSLTVSVSIYRRGGGLFATSFKRLETATFAGHWHDANPPAAVNPSCDLTQTSGNPFQDRFDLSSSGATFRIAVAAKVTFYGYQTAKPVLVEDDCNYWPTCNLTP